MNFLIIYQNCLKLYEEKVFLFDLDKRKAYLTPNCLLKARHHIQPVYHLISFVIHLFSHQ